MLIGLAALLLTAREEDPQIVVPLADVIVSMPGHSASEVEQLAATPLEKILYQIDGVEYVYSMSRENQAVITVRFYVGQDRERSLVKLFKKINEYQDIVPPGVAGWVVKPVEIDDVPIVTLTLAGQEGDSYGLRRVGEEVVQRLSALPGVSRASVVGGEPRTVRVDLDPERLQAHALSPLEVQRAIQAANVTHPAGDFTRNDVVIRVEGGVAADRPEQIRELVVGVFQNRPVFLKDVATVRDGPGEVASYIRHGWGPARGFEAPKGFPGTEVDAHEETGEAKHADTRGAAARPAVTLAISKQKGTNAVSVADSVLRAAEQLKNEVVPTGMELVITRNSGLTADEKVNELVDGLWVAIVIVIALLTLSLGWREAMIVAVAVPVVFGLTLGVNLLFGYTINRVTLFALILSLGLLVDDPIVDVENIARHFAMRGRATRDIVLEAVAEIRPPLISATLAVIVSFLPLFFITGMMGPYMAPMALNVPVAMLMSMMVAFTITPWMSYQVLHKKFNAGGHAGHDPSAEDDIEAIRRTFLYRLFRPMMAPLISSRWAALSFLAFIALLTTAAMGLAALRMVPLKMLPFDNKNELLLVLDFDEGTTLERANAAVRDVEAEVAAVPEVTDYVSYVGMPSPIDFNGLVRHYYLRQMPHNAEVRVNLVGKKHRAAQSHAIGLRLHDRLTALADKHHARLKVVELPPGPPVLASLVAEVSGRPEHSYDDLMAAAAMVARAPQSGAGGRGSRRHGRGPGAEARVRDRPGESRPERGLRRRDRPDASPRPVRRQCRHGAARGRTKSAPGRAATAACAPLQPPGSGEHPRQRADRAVHDTLGARPLGGGPRRPDDLPQEPGARGLRDRRDAGAYSGRVRPRRDLGPATGRHLRNGRGSDHGWVSDTRPRVLSERTFVRNGGGIPWAVPAGVRVGFSGEGEWKITLDVFRDLGLAFAAAMMMIYVILVMQTGSFLIPLVVMLAIPLTVLGVMPGFWLLNAVNGQVVGGYADPVLFTATGMIGMIALAGIVTRDAIILVDFIGQSVKKGRPLFDAIMESRVVRMRPILLTAGAAMLSSIPITLDPIFSGLAWSLIFGLVASTIFTLFVIPVSYWLIHPKVEVDNGDPARERES